MSIYATKTLTSSQELEVEKLLANPALQVYMEILAHNTAMDILTGTPGEGESDAEYLRKEQFLKGQISAYDLLFCAAKAAYQRSLPQEQ